MKKDDVTEGMSVSWTPQTWPKGDRVAQSGKVVLKGLRKAKIRVGDKEHWVPYHAIERG